jgi:NADH-quinone oxidoreductase subunit J
LIARDQVATTEELRDVERHLDREIEEGGAK